MRERRSPENLAEVRPGGFVPLTAHPESAVLRVEFPERLGQRRVCWEITLEFLKLPDGLGAAEHHRWLEEERRFEDRTIHLYASPYKLVWVIQVRERLPLRAITGWGEGRKPSVHRKRRRGAGQGCVTAGLLKPLKTRNSPGRIGQPCREVGCHTAPRSSSPCREPDQGRGRGSACSRSRACFDGRW